MVKMNIIWFSFHWTKSSNILKEINDIDNKILINNSDVSKIIKIIKSYDIIIWIGDYTWRDYKKNRIEKYCNNKFRNSLINVNTIDNIELYTPNDVDWFKLWNGMWNWFCNNSSYKISKYITENNINTKMMFIHVHKNYNKQEAINDINKVITNMKNQT